MLPQLHTGVTFGQVQDEMEKLSLPEVHNARSFEDLFRLLAGWINHLITTDFHRLIALLYRLDISEKKLKTLLASHKTEQAGNIIATMILERQMQKIVARQSFKTDTDIPEADKW